MNLYKKSTVKTYSLLVIDATLASDNPLQKKKFWKISCRKNIKINYGN